jgi:hypothetical protein
MRKFFSVFNTIISVLGTAAFAGGIWLLVDFKGPDDFPGFALSNCSLARSQVIRYQNCGYAALWQNEGAVAPFVMTSPFSVTESQALATSEASNYPLNTALPCICNFEKVTTFPATFNHDSHCNIWEAPCYLDTKLVGYIQKSSAKYVQLAEILIGFSAITTVVSLTVTIIMCACARRCSSGSGDDKNAGPLVGRQESYLNRYAPVSTSNPSWMN